MESCIKSAVFYGIVDLGYVAPDDAVRAARELIAGGAGVIQLRAKGVDIDTIKQVAGLILAVCRAAVIPMVVNDFAEIAAEIGADGVHIGQEDGSLSAVREVVGDKMMVGRSTHSPEQAAAALEEGFDYIGFGPLYPTPTKLGRAGIGLVDVAAVQSTVGCKIPVFCIGGIRRDNLSEVISAGARRVVVVSDVLMAADRTAAVAEVVSALMVAPKIL